MEKGVFMKILIDTEAQFDEVIAQINVILADVAITTNEAAKLTGLHPDTIRHSWTDRKSSATVLYNRVYSRREVENANVS
jgi:hypothetical protein